MIGRKRAALIAALALQATAFSSAPDVAAGAATAQFDVARNAEVLATISARCDDCAWDVEGREAVTISVWLDDRYVAHLPLVRQGQADYQVMLGGVKPGRHTVRAHIDPDATAKDLRREGAAHLGGLRVKIVLEGDGEYEALSLAPILYARPNTLGRFTDAPVFMWYEREATPRGTRYRYSVIFSNEDGGTPADRLMATWGRTTDIEYIYSAEVDASGKLLSDDFQGPEHEVLRFAGPREGRHPRLWVSTDNNMVRDTGTTRLRYAPAPVAFPLDGVSREVVMDANPWLYALMAQELAREGKIAENAPPGKGSIPDPRRFVYLEACGELRNAALAVELGFGPERSPSDRGVAQYRVVRDGCFRVATPIPPGRTAADLEAVSVAAHRRPADGKQPAPAASSIRLDRINTVFALDERYIPGPSLLTWEGPEQIPVGGPPLEVAIR